MRIPNWLWKGNITQTAADTIELFAMGVCVDDTVHFANWFRRATRTGLNHHDASVLAFENSAGAIYQSTVIVALGLVTFAISNFMPTHRFGLLMCTLLAFGLVADLVLTPAMLAGWIGRFFTVGCRPGKSASPSKDAAEYPAQADDRDMYAA
jgi:predicted RND superfamily exporter protein